MARFEATHRDKRQVDHPRRDDRRLSRSGPGDHDVGLQRHGYGGPLLERGPGSQRLDDLRGDRGEICDGAKVSGAHARTSSGGGEAVVFAGDSAGGAGNSSLPSGQSGQRGLNSQKRQFADGFGR